MISTLTDAAPATYRLGFASLSSEVRAATLPVEGSLPAWLTGTLFRNGPARFTVGTERYRHWFDGLAMIHRFAVADGSVVYGNRFLRTPAFDEAERTGRIARPEFATDPQPTLLERFGSRFGKGSSANANVNIVPFGDAYLALTETPTPVAFDGESLETRGVLAYDDEVTGQLETAHPHYDRVRRATFNVVVALGRTSAYNIVRIDAGTLQRNVIATIRVDRPAYLHAFSTTARHVIVAEYPLVVNPLDLLLRRKPYIENYRWKPERGARFHVVDKDTGERRGTFETDAFFAFHHINAFDDGDSVVLDISAYEDAAIVGDLLLERLLAPGPARIARSTFRRYRLVRGRSSAESQLITAAGTELPRIAPALAGLPYRYAYGTDNAAAGTEAFDGLVKVDAQTGTVTAWRQPHAYPGEPVFVPRPGAVDEDDGVVLAVVLDAVAATSYLLVLDARTFAEQARARVPHAIPFGFHGLFTASGESLG